MSSAEARQKEEQAVSTFLQAIFERKTVTMQYHSLYSQKTKLYTAHPQGLLWDRERWYLVGYSEEADEIRLWRADRVLNIQRGSTAARSRSDFQISRWLGRGWLREAMAQWMQSSRVVIRLSAEQAERLKKDWYYMHARYEDTPDGQALMTFGEDNQRIVFDLLRWLGPSAELIEPHQWRAKLRDELQAMLESYSQT